MYSQWGCHCNQTNSLMDTQLMKKRSEQTQISEIQVLSVMHLKITLYILENPFSAYLTWCIRFPPYVCYKKFDISKHRVEQTEPYSNLNIRFGPTGHPAYGIRWIDVSNERADCLTFKIIVCLMSSIQIKPFIIFVYSAIHRRK